MSHVRPWEWGSAYTQVYTVFVVRSILLVESVYADCDDCQSVTAFGRMMIDLTKKYVEEMFTISNGYEHDAQVSHSVLCCVRLHAEY